MTTKYVSDLMAKVYRLDAMLLEAKMKGDKGVMEMVEEYIEETLAELKQAEHMQEVANG